MLRKLLSKLFHLYKGLEPDTQYYYANVVKITPKLRERFCKDCNLPINIFEEPYFSDQLKLYDRFYNSLSKWEIFVTALEKYDSEQKYFEID